MSRISIQYSIESDELEGEMLRLINNSLKKLQDAADNLKSLSTNLEKDNKLLSSETTSRLALVRQRIADVDFNLGDATNIIGGYVNYQLEAQMAAANAPTEMSQNYAQETGAHPTPDMYEHEIEGAPLNPYTRNTTSEMVKNLDAFESLVNKISTMNEDELDNFRGFSHEQLAEQMNEIKENSKNGE